MYMCLGKCSSENISKSLLMMKTWRRASNLIEISNHIDLEKDLESSKDKQS